MYYLGNFKCIEVIGRNFLHIDQYKRHLAPQHCTLCTLDVETNSYAILFSLLASSFPKIFLTVSCKNSGRESLCILSNFRSMTSRPFFFIFMKKSFSQRTTLNLLTITCSLLDYFPHLIPLFLSYRLRVPCSQIKLVSQLSHFLDTLEGHESFNKMITSYYTCSAARCARYFTPADRI